MCDCSAKQNISELVDKEPRNLSRAVEAQAPQGEILTEISTQEKMLSELRMLLNELRDRIQPVSTDNPQPENQAATADQYYETQVGSLLNENNSSLRFILTHANELIERVKI